MLVLSTFASRAPYPLDTCHCSESCLWSLCLDYILGHQCFVSFHEGNQPNSRSPQICPVICPYEDSVLKFLCCREELLSQVYQTMKIEFVVLGTVYANTIFQGHHRLHIYEKVEHMQPLVERTKALWMLYLDMFRNFCIPASPLLRRILILFLLPCLRPEIC